MNQLAEVIPFLSDDRPELRLNVCSRTDTGERYAAYRSLCHVVSQTLKLLLGFSGTDAQVQALSALPLAAPLVKLINDNYKVIQVAL